MPTWRLVSIKLGPGRSYRNPISLEQLRALAATRTDVEVRVGDTGTRAARDMIVIDPTRSSIKTLTLIDGRLETLNPDDETIEWMLDLAKALNARVVDNTLRTYRSPREKYIHPDDVEARKALARSLRIAGNKQIPFTHTIIKWIIIGIFLAIAGAGYAIFSK
jgi:uncharacterized UPF0146 family protein